jgi:TPR repeat protein
LRLFRLIICTVFLAVPAYADNAPVSLPNLKAPAMDSAASVNYETVPDLKTILSRAAKGDPLAQDLVGKHYEEGDGVKQDSAKAAKWYFRGAQQGYAQAQNDLGYLYLKGEGVPQDYGQAYFWITLSLDPFDASSAKIRDDIAQYLSPAELSEQEMLLNDWKATMEKNTSGDGDHSFNDPGCTPKPCPKQ